MPLLLLLPGVAILRQGRESQGAANADEQGAPGVLHEDNGVASDELLVVDELAPAGGEEVPAGGPAVDVAELPGDAVDVGDGENLHRRVVVEVERREDGVGAEPRHGEPAAVVGVRRGQNLREGEDLLAAGVRFLGGFFSGGTVAGGDGIEEELGKDLVGQGIGEELDGGDAAEDEGEGAEERVEVVMVVVNGRREGLFQVALWEVVNPRMHGGDLDCGTGARAPDFGVQTSRLRRRTAGLRWGHRREKGK